MSPARPRSIGQSALPERKRLRFQDEDFHFTNALDRQDLGSLFTNV